MNKTKGTTAIDKLQEKLELVANDYLDSLQKEIKKEKHTSEEMLAINDSVRVLHHFIGMLIELKRFSPM
jgi:hypothetical protein